MEPPKSVGPAANPLLSFSSFIQQNLLQLGAELAGRLDETKRFTSKFAASLQTFTPPRLPLHCSFSSPSSSSPTPASSPLALSFASVSQSRSSRRKRKQGSTSDGTLSSTYVAKTLAGTSVYTVSNSNNEFVLISNSDGAKSIGLLCFRHEDAEALLAQVRSKKVELRRGAKVVPISLEQVYMLKVEGISFRFLPDPVQVKNALELKSSDVNSGFDGVPVFQSDRLVVNKKNKRFSPIYFRKEDIEKELSKLSRGSRGSRVSQRIVVGSLEDVLKKMGVSKWNSGWEDLIFIPPGKSYSQHFEEVEKA